MASNLITEKEERQILMTMASILKNNCENHHTCKDCPLYGRHKPYVGECCPFSVGSNPSDWVID